MEGTSYRLDTTFAAQAEKILAPLHPARRRALTLEVHERVPPFEPFEPTRVAEAYATALGLLADQVRFFARVDRIEAARIAASVAATELVMGTPQMPRAAAEELATAWLHALGEDVVFLVNGAAATGSPPGAEPGPSLVHKDVQAGVLAVSPTRAGLFWAAEDS